MADQRVVGLFRALQERTARAFPPVTFTEDAGWLLRYPGPGPWWTGSVLPPAGRSDLIDRVEERYAGRPVHFQIGPGAAALDAELAARGYTVRSPMSLRTAMTTDLLDLPAPLAVYVDHQPTVDWFVVQQAVHGGDPTADKQMLGRVRPPSAYATVRSGGVVIAAGRAVAEDGWVGLFGVATMPAARGRGAASSVLAALARWATGHGAERAYLQVEPDNAAAIQLYDRAGFKELSAYHYRELAR